MFYRVIWYVCGFNSKIKGGNWKRGEKTNRIYLWIHIEKRFLSWCNNSADDGIEVFKEDLLEDERFLQRMQNKFEKSA